MRNQDNQQHGKQNQNIQNQDRTSGQASASAREPNMGQREQQTAYWRQQYQSEPYYSQGEGFEQYEPAYRTAIEGRDRYAGQQFNEIESSLKDEYQANQGSNTMSWDTKGKQACRAAWDHADRNTASSGERQSSNDQASNKPQEPGRRH